MGSCNVCGRESARGKSLDYVCFSGEPEAGGGRIEFYQSGPGKYRPATFFVCDGCIGERLASRRDAEMSKVRTSLICFAIALAAAIAVYFALAPYSGENAAVALFMLAVWAGSALVWTICALMAAGSLLALFKSTPEDVESLFEPEIRDEMGKIGRPYIPSEKFERWANSKS